MEITKQMLEGAVRGLVAEVLSTERIEQLVDDEIRQRIGTVSVSDLAREWGCDERTVQRKLKKHNVPVSVLSRKLVRVKVAHIEALLDGRSVGGGAVNITPFTKPPGRRKAA